MIIAAMVVIWMLKEPPDPYAELKRYVVSDFSNLIERDSYPRAERSVDFIGVDLATVLGVAKKTYTAERGWSWSYDPAYSKSEASAFNAGAGQSIDIRTSERSREGQVLRIMLTETYNLRGPLGFFRRLGWKLRTRGS